MARVETTETIPELRYVSITLFGATGQNPVCADPSVSQREQQQRTADNILVLALRIGKRDGETDHPNSGRKRGAWRESMGQRQWDSQTICPHRKRADKCGTD